jgi:periplasmic divalent cation tolerance protein
MSGDVVAVLISAPDADTARRIGRTLVEERLAACVNVIPGVSSIYRWKGAVEEAAEVLLVVKTRAARADALAARVRTLHPYELPEVVVLPVRGGSRAYMQWVAAESR